MALVQGVVQLLLVVMVQHQTVVPVALEPLHLSQVRLLHGPVAVEVELMAVGLAEPAEQEAVVMVETEQPQLPEGQEP
jgi:hypothetical protein